MKDHTAVGLTPQGGKEMQFVPVVRKYDRKPRPITRCACDICGSVLSPMNRGCFFDMSDTITKCQNCMLLISEDANAALSALRFYIVNECPESVLAPARSKARVKLEEEGIDIRLWETRRMLRM